MTDYTSLSNALNNPADVTHLEIDAGEGTNKALARLSEFTKLRRLYLRNGFTGLPKGVVAPASLTELQVVVTDLEFEGERIIEALPGLEILEIWGKRLEQGTLPTEIGKMTKLRELHLVSCGITDLPSTMSALTSLRELYIRGCPIKKFPEAITEIPHLQRLDLSSSLSRMRSLPNNLAKLKELRHLDLSGALSKGKKLPTALGALESLEILILAHCGVNNEFKALQPLTQLKVLDISWGQTSDLAGLSSLSGLKELKIESCYGVLDLSPLEALPKLRSLTLNGNVYIKDISGITGLTQLKELDIERCINIKNLKPVLEHSTLEILTADDDVMERWQQKQQLRDMPSETALLELLAAGEYSVVAKALDQTTALVQINSTGEKSAAFSFFGVENLEEALVDVPVLDAALEKWGSKLPASLLVAVARMCMVSITENLKPALTAIQLLGQRGEAEAQKEIAAIFHSACSHYESGHRCRESSLLDQLIDDTFESFHPAALAVLLKDCDSDALGADSMDELFQVALGKTEALDEGATSVLVRKFCEYAKERVDDDAAHIEGLRKRIREVNETASTAIDKALNEAPDEAPLTTSPKPVAAKDSAEAEVLNEKFSALLQALAKGRDGKFWESALGTLRRMATLEATIQVSHGSFCILQKGYESKVNHKQWSQVKDFLKVFVSSTRNIEWGQAAIETIAADGVVSAHLSGDEEISELVFGQLVPDTVEKDRLAYNLACYYACKKDKENVLRYTRRALELGKASALFRADKDFSPFWEEAEFNALFE